MLFSIGETSKIIIASCTNANALFSNSKYNTYLNLPYDYTKEEKG